MNVAADFESDHGLRFAHRRDGSVELYFVSNPEPTAVDATCRFRVTGKQAELWDPLTGEIRRAASFRQEDGRTILPLQFPPSGSLFVVFRRPSDRSAAEGRNGLELERLVSSRPWNVHFDPRWGGPGIHGIPDARRLDQPAEPGIRYYSGSAVYTRNSIVYQNADTVGFSSYSSTWAG